MIPEKHNGPGANRTVAGKSFDGDNAILAAAAGAPPRIAPGTLPANYLEQFTLRLLQDALAQATSGYWERRAAVLEDARPRPGEFHGRASREALRARWERLSADAQECRRHGDLFTHEDVDVDLLREVIGLPLEAVA